MTEKDWMLNWLLTSGDFEVEEESQDNTVSGKGSVNSCDEKVVNIQKNI